MLFRSSGPCAAVAFAVGFAAYSEMLPQGAAVAFVLAEVAVNGAVVERDLVVFAQVGAYLPLLINPLPLYFLASEFKTTL